MEQQAEKVVYAYATRGGKLIEKEDGKKRMVGAQRIGCVAVIESGGSVHFGWSLCRKGDSYDSRVGREIAVNRARKRRDYMEGRPGSEYVRAGGSRTHDLPHSLYGPLDRAMTAADRALLKREDPSVSRD